MRKLSAGSAPRCVLPRCLLAAPEPACRPRVLTGGIPLQPHNFCWQRFAATFGCAIPVAIPWGHRRRRRPATAASQRRAARHVRSKAAEPVVALILPIAAGVIVEHGQSDHVLGVLEAELGRNANA